MKNLPLKGLILTIGVPAMLAVLTTPVSAQPRYRLAQIISADNPNEGRCTVSVIVDRATDVEIRGDTASLREVGGGPAQWQRFECTAPLPYAPVDLRLRAVEGDGRMTMTRDTYSGGVAMVRIDNEGPDGGLFTFDVYWDNNGRNQQSTEADRAVPVEEAIGSCRNAAEDRIRDEGYSHVRIGTIGLDERGYSDRVTGTAMADTTYGSDSFDFTCRIDPSGMVRRLDLSRR